MSQQGVGLSRGAWATTHVVHVKALGPHATAQSKRALCTRQTCDSALFGVIVHGHCSRTLYMGTVKKKGYKKLPPRFRASQLGIRA